MNQPDSTISTVITVNTEKIGFFRFILESYDNLAILTTLDRQQGVVALRYPAGNQAEVEELLTALPPQLVISVKPTVPVDPTGAPPAPPSGENLN
ncbi:DUF4911 domain-containing protein [Desulfurivibrio dismutans]|uniref:DUF4911 domain-containing protein n=1 Tax=Desulfurivibrio dismutans TaxID=1398908 RepID=UPI0023DA1429|nr:DUF4911 domain-containing protein [Desulfurivibrio alkaliphilus]MDF1615021.1 DUF4911 domain-containing protein [Desulfurivibrio alkaliphilus]